MRHIRLLHTLFLLFVLTTLNLKAQDGIRKDGNRQLTVSKSFTAYIKDSLELDGSKLWFADSVLLGSRSLSVTAIKGDEIPEMEYGMVNVTVGGEGYRYLPHGTHFKGDGATVRLGYDPSRIPAGYTEQDIYTFYYDEQERRWIALERVGIDRERHCVVSRTTHFTDMVNGIIQTPSMPETEGFAPTMMNDLPVADPASKVNIIAPPSANSHGSATLSYPLEMPPARNGMTPDVSIRYDSDGGSGWLGEGWDLPVPSITVDTRWGVPRYDTAKETETYLLNGQMLSMMNGQQLTVAHRDTTVQRTADRQFYSRQGGDFSRIIRKGSNPAGYYWEVTDRNGVKYTYGGSENSRLSDESSGYIAEWKLSSIEETHGDHVEYEYEKRDEVIAGNVTAKAIYLKKIKVCHAGISDTIITVTFTNGQQKAVKANSGRYGFLTSRNALLTGIDIKFRGSDLRSYTFTYGSGRFGKDLLTSVTHRALNDNGTLTDFATQTFTYYDTDTGNNVFSSNTSTLNVTDDHLGPSFSISTLTQDGRNTPTAIGGTGTTSVGTSVYTGVGTYIPLPFKTGTAGMSAGVSLDKSNGISTLVDINGDGLPDKLFRKSESVYTRLATATSGDIQYGQDILLSGLDGFLTTTSLSTSFGGKGTLGSGALIAMRGIDQTKTRVTTSEYLMDINGDGLVDYVKDEKVYFNHLDGNGIPTFTLNSGDTPNPLGHTGSVDTSLADDDTTDEQEMADASPMMDVVRFWEAPRDGLVSLSGTITQLQVADDNYDEADGVRAAIQIGSTEVWSQVIPKGGSASYSLTDRTVAKGQRIYFRLQAGSQAASNGYGDLVRWIPYVEYTDIDCYQDTPDGFDDKSFDIGNGLIYSNDDCVRVPENRKLVVTGTISKPTVSDHVLMQVVGYSDSDSPTPHVLASTIVHSDDGSTTKTMTIANNQGYRNIHVELSAKSNINWVDPDFSFTIKVYAASSSTVIDTTMACPYKIRPVTRMIHAGEQYHAGITTSIRIRPNASLITPGYLNNPSDSIYLSVKTPFDDLVFQKAYTTTTLQSLQYVTVNLDGYDAADVWFEYSYPGKWTNTIPLQPYVTVYDSQTGSTQNVKAAFFTRRDDERFGPMFRGWGGFIYNAGSGRYAQPIDESLLTLPTDSASANPTTMVLLPMYADMSHPNDPLMRGLSDRLWFNDYEVRTGRLGIQDITFGSSSLLRSSSSGDGIAVTQKSVNTGTVVQDEISFGTCSDASGENVVKSAMMDMNGDGYPDLVTNHGIQYSTVLGGLGGRRYQGDGMERTYNSSYAVGVGGSAVPSFPGINIIQGARDAGHAGFAKALSVLKEISLQGNDNYNVDTTVCGFFDINGDGLPDRFTKNTGGGMEVALNIGNGFAAPYPWKYGDIRVNKSMAASVGGSGNIDIAATSLAAGITYVTSGSRDMTALADINGDGLPDLLKDTGNGLQVRLNTGSGFGSAVQISNLSSIGVTQSTSESVNVAFTANILLPTIPASMLSVSPSGSVSQSVSRPVSALTDIDGDGYTDIVSSDNAGTMQVRYSTLGRTNRLKTVTNALGGTFTIDYSHTDASYDLPGGRWVMSALEVDDGIDDDGPAMRSRFDYGGGRYDRREREFLGFATVSTIELDTENADAEYRRTVETYDNQSYYHQGALTSTAVKDATGSTLSEKATSYYTYGVTPSGNAYTLTETNTVNDHGAYFVAPKYTEDRLSGTVMTQSLTKYKTSASHGELSDYYYSDKGTMNASTGSGYDYHTEISYNYATANTTYHVYGLPTKVEVTYGNNTQETDATYSTSHPTHITKLRKKIAGSQYAETDYTYDSQGNVTSVTYPSNSQSQRYALSYEYETDMGMYVKKITDSHQLSARYEDYDYRYGIARTRRDINDFYTYIQTDEKGRTTAVTGPKEVESGHTTVTYEFTPAVVSANGQITSPAHTVTRQYDAQHNSYIQTVSFTDGFGRIIQTKKDAVVDGTAGMTISGKEVYDAFGRTAQSYHPVFAQTASLAYSSAVDTQNPTETFYDELDRTVSITHPDNTSRSYDYSIGNISGSGNTLITEVTDEEGNTSVRYTNGSGKTVRTERYHDGNPITSDFQYDGIGHLVSSADDDGNTTAMTYDLADRMTRVIHPASGETRYRYDPAGNLVSLRRDQDISNGDSIVYVYDYERLSQVQFPNETANNVTYTYGSYNGEQNGRGHLIKRIDGSGSVRYTYDNMGNVVEEKRSLIVPFDGNYTFTTKWRYDSFNRLMWMQYPDDEQLDYTYDTAGNLLSVRGFKENGTYSYYYLSGIRYDKFGDRISMTFNNGYTTTFSYDPQRRWFSSMTSVKGTRRLVDNEYTYDNVGNILSVNGNATIPASGILGGSATHQFTYDDMYRLTSATGTYTGCTGKSGSYSLTTAYDNVFRITGKNQTVSLSGINYGSGPDRNLSMSYHYRGDNPYRLSHITHSHAQTPSSAMVNDSLILDYDNNGSILKTVARRLAPGYTYTADSVRYIYDHDKRLAASDNNGLLCGYLYDADGERSLKINVLASNLLVNSQASSSSYGMDYTIYVNPYMVWQMGGVYTKHYYIGGERFLSSLGNGNTISNPKTVAAVELSLINAKRSQQEARLAEYLSIFGVPLNGIQSLGSEQVSPSATLANTSAVQSDMTAGRLQYYYHADHLGSTGYITGLDGTVLQHVEYIPGGEAFFEEKAGSWSTPYLFSSKELDDETGLYYFGARYYNSHLGIWMSTDPMELDYPEVSSYAYCHGNPVNRIDLWGMSDEDPPSTVSVLRNFGKGLWNSVSNTFTGLWNTVSHPINTVESVGNAVMHPVETGRAIVQAATQTYEDFQSGDANVKAAIIGEGVGEAAQMFIGGGKAVVKVSSLSKGSVKSITRKALTNEELVNKAADKAHRAIEGSGHVVGTKKHTYATKLIDRYQKIYGDRGLHLNLYFDDIGYGKGFLDVYDKSNNAIYDFKFGKTARMSKSQYYKYSNSFPDATIRVIKRQ